MIIFNKLDITSFKSIYHISIDFINMNNNFYTMEGKNHTVNFASSNGAGKSTVWDALSYVLYGTTMGIYLKKEDYQNKNTSIPLNIKLYFSIDSGISKGDYILVRTLNSTQLYKNDEDISELNKTETEKKLANVLNLTKDEFFSFTYLTQTAGGGFLGKTASEKMSVIKDFIFGEELLQIKNRIDSLLKENIKQFTQTEKEIAKLEGNIESLQKTLKSLSERKQQNSEYNYDEIVVKENEQKILELKQKQYKLRKEEQKKAILKQEYNALRKQMQQLKTQLERIKENICPTCGQKLQSNEVEFEVRQKAKNVKLRAIEITNELKKFENKDNILDDIDKELSLLVETVTKMKASKQIDIESKSQVGNLQLDLDTKLRKIEELQNEVIKLEYEQKQLKELQKYFNSTFIQYVQKAFLTEIENYLNLYCYDVFNESFSLKFSNNSLDLFVGDHPYSYFSGGERQRIDFLFVFAIKVALSSFTDKCTNLLIFDESLSGSDSVAFDNSVDLINRLSSASDLITVLISHRDNNTFSNKIVIEKFENKTKLFILEGE